MAYPFDNPFDQLCTKLGLYNSVETEGRSALLALDYEIQDLPPGWALVKADQPVKNCSILLDGIAYRSKTVGSGERQILSVHVPGEILDLTNLLIDVADHDILMLTDATIAIFSREALEEIAFKFPSVGRALWHESLVEQSLYREWLTNIGRRDSLTRTAHLLCEFSLRLDHTDFSVGHGYELPMSQEQMGDCLGLTSVHVNRMLRQLETMHLISRVRRSIQVTDWQGLQDVGDFTPDYLHYPELAAA
jgi:CRP-like cAMP-binding protein